MAHPAKANDVLTKITEVVRSGRARSPLYRLLRSHHDALMSLLEENRPNWRRLTEVFTENGLTREDGQPLKPESVRSIWHQVRRDVAKARAKRTERAAPLVTLVRPSPTPSPAPVPVIAGTQEDNPALSALWAELAAKSGRK